MILQRDDDHDNELPMTTFSMSTTIDRSLPTSVNSNVLGQSSIIVPPAMIVRNHAQ